ncbi:MAG TPA: hypothetical protein DC047_06805 [Blastocatellia bacterium]|nr:hypothetical protein [Blastocatellia bacterium]
MSVASWTVLGLWSLVLGLGFLVFGFWPFVFYFGFGFGTSFGLGFLKSGIWNLVFSLLPTAYCSLLIASCCRA